MTLNYCIAKCVVRILINFWSSRNARIQNKIIIIVIICILRQSLRRQVGFSAVGRHRFWNCWLCNLSGAAVTGQSQRRRKSALLQPSRARQPYRALIRPVCPVARHEERESSKGRQEGALIWTNIAARNFLDFYPLVIFVLLVIFLTL